MLRVEGLSVLTHAAPHLQDITFDVWPGETVGIAGDNGSGKTTLLRSICGEVPRSTGTTTIGSASTPATMGLLAHTGVVWQHPVLSDNLDIAANLLLGKEERSVLFSDRKAHRRAARILADLGIELGDPTRPTRTLTVGERQFLALARAMSPQPRLLLLDEPTAILNRADSPQAERLIRRFHGGTTGILLASHDVGQLFRLADRILVLRAGRIVARVDPTHSHPDELLALMAGHDSFTVPRRQLGRLHTLVDQLSSTGPATEVTLILQTLGAALEVQQLSLHLVDGDRLACVGAVGIPAALEAAWHDVPLAEESGPLARAIIDNQMTARRIPLAADIPTAQSTAMHQAGITDWWVVPFVHGTRLRGAISICRTSRRDPTDDEIDLVKLYIGYAVAPLERERLLAQLTTRNRTLEAIRAVLQTLAGAEPLEERVARALGILRDAVGAAQTAMVVRAADGKVTFRSNTPTDEDATLAPLLGTAERILEHPDDATPEVPGPPGFGRCFVRLAPNTVLAAEWSGREAADEEIALLEDAGHSILLARERERAEAARREAAALRRSREMQRQFLARLSHELRTPLTAIHGYASSLMQPDVTWDEPSERRFLGRISSESARLRRLVQELLDFSLIESGMLRLRPDWVDIPLIVDAARSCLPAAAIASVAVRMPGNLPPVWADHDRIEQVFVNLMDNAVRHNPPGTRVSVDAHCEGGDLLIAISDETPAGPRSGRARWRDATGGAGIGLSITRGILAAHHGNLDEERNDTGRRYTVRLPVEPAGVTVADPSGRSTTDEPMEHEDV